MLYIFVQAFSGTKWSISGRNFQDWSCGLNGTDLQLQGTMPSCVPSPCSSGRRLLPWFFLTMGKNTCGTDVFQDFFIQICFMTFTYLFVYIYNYYVVHQVISQCKELVISCHNIYIYIYIYRNNKMQGYTSRSCMELQNRAVGVSHVISFLHARVMNQQWDGNEQFKKLQILWCVQLVRYKMIQSVIFH